MDSLPETVLLAPEKGCTTMLPSFARSYIESTGHEVVAVHAARGSTVVSFWLPETEGYDSIIKKTNAAIKKVGRENIGKIMAEAV
jgi:hypothetical protein